MSRKYLVIAVAALVGVGLMAFVLTSAPTDRAVPPAPPDLGVNAPPTDGGEKPQEKAALGADHVLAVGAMLRFEDSLVVELMKIDDSRCPAGVQCIWAGELSPTLRLEGGSLVGAMEIRLGTTTAQSAEAGPYVVTLRSATETSVTIAVTLGAPVDTSRDDLIRATSPTPGQLVTSPLVVTGEARGTWYFEASFPVKLLDADGNVIVSHYAQAQGEWMTTEFVPFSSTLTFAMPATATGTLVLEKDNPSGLPEHDDAIRIPVRFRADGDVVPKTICRRTGCSGEVCSDENVGTACVFKPEYACYKSATCGRLDNGKCGWLVTPELTQCLKNPPPIE